MLTLLIAATAQVAPVAAPEAHSLVRVDLTRPELLIELLRSDFDVPFVDPAGEYVQVLVDDQELLELRGAGHSVAVLSSDLARSYAERLERGPAVHGTDHGQWLSPPFGQGGMGGYYTFTEIESILDQMRAQYPNLISAKASIGSSLEGRDLWMVRISDSPDVDEGEPEVRYDCLHHSREPQGMQATIWFMSWLLESYGTDPLATYLVEEREMYFIPVVNPDGYVYNQTTNPGGGGLWRKNRRNNGGGSFGVDLNRNYPFEWGADNVGSSPNPDSETYRGPSPASEPETQAMVNFISGRDFGAALSIHTFSNLWLAPYGYDEVLPANYDQYLEVGELVTEANGYAYGAVWSLLYLANGGTLDYDHAVHDTLAFSPEIGSQSDGFWPPQSRIVPLAEENLLALQRTALSAGPWVYVSESQLVDAGDGDAFLNPGGTGELTITLRNSGVAGTGTGIEVRLESSNASFLPGMPWISGPLAAGDEVENSAQPLTFDLAPDAVVGSSLAYELIVAFDGAERSIPGHLIVGEPRRLIADDLELDLGWTAGVFGDGATTGLWELADPIATSSGGEAANPGDDVTGGAGHLCFVTGNGGGSAGNDDVDGGPTTLVSPPIDLSHVDAAVLRYHRWFADLSTTDDQLEVSVSFDNGLTWGTLETVTGNQNEWTEVSFSLGDYTPLTDSMRVRWRTGDDPNNSVLEAGVDEVSIDIYDLAPRMVVYGTPALGTDLAFNVSSQPGDQVQLYASRFPGNSTVPGVNGTLLLNPDTMFPIAVGNIPGDGLFSFVRTLPANPALRGTSFYFQAFVTSGGATTLTNRDELVFE